MFAARDDPFVAETDPVARTAVGTERMLALLAELRAGHATLLVEHDMDAVFRIADWITVMVNGAVIASAAPEAIRNDPAVQAAYLGGH